MDDDRRVKCGTLGRCTAYSQSSRMMCSTALARWMLRCGLLRELLEVVVPAPRREYGSTSLPDSTLAPAPTVA